jgi:hypothetical protein
MSAPIRQENLYGAEDWRLVYTSFKNAEFQSYDFDTLRGAMIEYLQLNYPEEYNDYIQSSEFVALVDLVAFVGQNLSFRMDLNARENILDTAEKRESVLRIARMLSYKPKRVRPAEGLLQVVAVRTTEQIIDSTGSNLSNQLVTWGADPSELDYERFIKIIDSALNSTNKFGTPVQKVVNSVSGDKFEIYQFNNVNRKTEYNIPAYINNSSINFDVVPVQLSDDGIIEQITPTESTAFTLLYRNDGKGTGSIRTGFFALTKQGSQLSQVFRFDAPKANAVIDLYATANISEDDFYVQTLDIQGNVVKNWTRVGAIDNSNLVVNQYGNSNKDLFEVIYSDADITSIKFGDGLFTNSAEGIIRVWYRLAENDFMKVKSGDISNKIVDLDYINADGESHTLEITLKLQESMTTGIPAENVDEIKINAPEAFYSKNRMVTGDDYAGFLPTLNNNALLLKAENRTFAGYSRYTDLNDPTGKSRSLVEFADDGYMYYDEGIKTVSVADKSGVRPIDFIEEYLETKLNNISLLNFYYGKLDLQGTGETDKFKLVDVASEQFKWKPAFVDNTSANGYITNKNVDNADVVARLGFTTYGDLRSIRPGSLIKLQGNSTTSWIIVNDIKGNGLGQEDDAGDYTGLLVNGHGTVEINKPINVTSTLQAIVPAFPRTFDENTRATIAEYLSAQRPFALALDHTQPKWTVIDTTQIDPAILTSDWNCSTVNNSWLLHLERSESGWVINYRTLDYVFGSESLLRFYNINFASTQDPNFKTIGTDKISVITMSNNKLVPQATYTVTGYYNYKDGYTDNSKVKITPLDVDNDLLPDDPNHFLKVVGSATIGLKNIEEDEFTYLVPTTNNDTDAISVVPGTTGLSFKWAHDTYIDQTLNPSLTNIVDVYVLTKSYNEEFVKWKNKGATGLMPEPPTSEELKREFKNLDSYKMATDEVIFHPVTFKTLFGSSADESLQAQFKVVKYAKSKMTDNELKSKVLAAIDSFFAIGNFDFGETFYFTELAAYIHAKLKTDINSIVIVPVSSASTFGTLFQITPNKNELITSTATVNDIVVIREITDQNIRKA